MTSNQSHKRHKTFFAITSLGKKRWFWVVWASLYRSSGRHPISVLIRGHLRLLKLLVSAQMRLWLQRAVESGKAQQLSELSRYICASPTSHRQQLSFLNG